MTMPPVGLKIKYPWTDANRHRLLEVVKVVKGEGKNQSLKWREVARRLHNDSDDLDESNFGRLCAKQFDNLYRAYTKFRQDGDQPPRLTKAVIEEFDELFPSMTGAGKVSEEDRIGGSVDDKSSSPEPTTGRARGRKGHNLTWTNISRINLLTAIRVAATKEGKIRWKEVVECMPNDFGVSEDRLCLLCMKQFTELVSRYKEYKTSGCRPRRLTTEVMQNLDELYETFPNLNPLPAGGPIRLGFRSDREDVSKDRVLSSPAASDHGLDHRSSSRLEVPPLIMPGSEPSSGSKDAHASAPVPVPVPAFASEPQPVPASMPCSDPAPAPEKEPVLERAPCSAPATATAPDPDSNREGDETSRARRKVAQLGKRKERTEASSSQKDLSTHEDFKDDQEVGFDRMERELLQLKSWLKQEVLPVGKEVLSRVKAYGMRNQTSKKSKYDPHDDFDKLIHEASQKSTILFIRAQFQQARANILKEVKDTIERVGMDLLHRRTNLFESSPADLPGHPQDL